MTSMRYNKDHDCLRLTDSNMVQHCVIGGNLCLLFTCIFFSARCTVPAQRSRVLIGGVKLWPYDIPEGVVPHWQNVTFYCKDPDKHCSFTSMQSCFDGQLTAPDCYLGESTLSCGEPCNCEAANNLLNIFVVYCQTESIIRIICR